MYKKLSKLTVGTLKEEQLTKDLETVYSIYESMEKIRKSKLSKPFTGAFKKVDFFETRKAYMEPLYRLNELCASLFMDYNADSFFSMCLRAQSGYTAPVLEGLKGALKSFSKAETSFLKITNADKSKAPEEDVLEAYTLKAGTLIDNIDMLANWCAYKQTAKTLGEAGLTFITDALESGSVSGENIVASFEKNIYKNFLQTKSHDRSAEYRWNEQNGPCFS